MKPPPFAYHRPFDLSDALALMARYGADAKPLSGGQSLVPMLNMRIARPANLVDLNDLAELDYVRRREDALEIGALTRHHRLATAPEIRKAIPLLAHAAGGIAHYAIRQRGTLGGSLAHADPAAQLPLVALVLDAEISIRSQASARSVPAGTFLRSIMTVDLAPDELVTAVRFPRPPAGAGWAFEVFQRRPGDFPLAAVAALVECAPSGEIARLALGLGGVAPTPLRVTRTEASAAGAQPDPDWIDGVAHDVAAGIDPDDEPRLPAAFRRELVAELSAKALRSALGRCGVR